MTVVPSGADGPELTSQLQPLSAVWTLGEPHNHRATAPELSVRWTQKTNAFQLMGCRGDSGEVQWPVSSGAASGSSHCAETIRSLSGFTPTPSRATRNTRFAPGPAGHGGGGAKEMQLGSSHPPLHRAGEQLGTQGLHCLVSECSVSDSTEPCREPKQPAARDKRASAPKDTETTQHLLETPSNDTGALAGPRWLGRHLQPWSTSLEVDWLFPGQEWGWVGHRSAGEGLGVTALCLCIWGHGKAASSRCLLSSPSGQLP